MAWCSWACQAPSSYMNQGHQVSPIFHQEEAYPHVMVDPREQMDGPLGFDRGTHCWSFAKDLPAVPQILNLSCYAHKT